MLYNDGFDSNECGFIGFYIKGFDILTLQRLIGHFFSG